MDIPALAQSVEGRSLMTADRREAIIRAVLDCAGLPGDMAEVGVYTGGTARIIATACPEKTVHLYDTFEGMPVDDLMPNGHLKGHFAARIEDVREYLQGLNVQFHQGWFPATAVDTTYCFAHIDGDIYQTTLDAIDFFWPRLTPGGKMIFDDYRWQACLGVERAILERNLTVEETVPFQCVATKPSDR
jgi:O-methyltransferase